jgi:dienelactone hydrolase
MFRTRTAIQATALVLALAALRGLGPAAHAAENDLAEQVAKLDGTVLPVDGDEGKQPTRMLAQDVQARLREANRRESRAWQQIRTRADWEKFRDVRLQALRASLGTFPPVPKDLKVRVLRTLDGDGYCIENLTFESRPGLVVTANLYLPRDPPKSMPGILICHSHHNPKTQGELQYMGMTWAKLGCAVLVMDQLGHGERRQHPFLDASSYPHSFRPGRQDYYFRYNVGLQLYVIGDSLMGWMVWDLQRGIDLLLARPGIDKERIVLVGAVAGGGDPAAVTAALDSRITAVIPFNFGGPQPETAYPLAADAEESFNYAGSGSWESTRNLRLSARGGFLPWVIVGAAAPRRLIYAHEFAWDRERDPVWKRLETIYGFYEVPDRLASVNGRGAVTGKPPEATHCNNVGPEHRKGIYPALKRWFDVAVPTREEQRRRPAEELTCLDAKEVLKPVHELASRIGAERAEAARKRLADLAPEARRKQLRQDWARLLGTVDPKADPRVAKQDTQRLGKMSIERIALEIEPGIQVPLLLLIPEQKPDERLPIVLAFAQHGKQAFLKDRSEALAELLQGGVAVCLPDLRGTGETRPAGDGRGRSGAGTSLSATELMLGETLLGARLRDLRAVLRHLRGRTDLDVNRVGLWGDSFAPANPDGRRLEVPLDADALPDQAEPLGALLALFGALFEDNVRATYARGGLTGYQTLLDSPFCYVPHDAVVPGALTAGDLCDVAAALAPRPLRLTALVDGRNRRVASGPLAETLAPAHVAYAAAKARDRFMVEANGTDSASLARWLVVQLKTAGASNPER